MSRADDLAELARLRELMAELASMSEVYGSRHYSVQYYDAVSRWTAIHERLHRRDGKRIAKLKARVAELEAVSDAS